MTEPAEQDPPPEKKESPVAFARSSLPANLLAAALCGVLTLWLGESMPAWPRSNTFSLVYILMLPFLAFFPLAGLTSLGWAAKTLLLRAAPAGIALWFFFVAALLINLFALPAFALGVRELLTV
ncbi:MAG: hypothetical protein NT115_05530 [Proteobacteria bacterium]|nr:hypothetical protein [Pseudomonadota bacterium]